ncbi:MAG: tyrosine--tRNA ligase [Treponema porcinum]|uniref:tyrosine--tRNA ligase n=1 Tax=Treponema porcinum TaxID=261392 RepID=UPI002357B23D|nr:tyrosine--tRNA ligase [Treponema porcinum]MCI6178995.1 tyrosine--tRNA ligase [Treponema porcinum]MCI6982695.1 tyrosine--tRNA ligase [Treponema porcinum]MCI7080679.1 tyrosine--tRNA ligase [Treponema porcinum]MCI7533976.1 tyrosine--tRNA ligase [Treponema porcinum]MDY4190107.1 tyrosine--tRNA ligase [Treponema porcinum]
MTLFEDLKWRGLIKDIAGEESDLQKVLDGSPFSFYWGTDPTADSLHLGHYSSLCMAKRLANAGHHPVLLCGGATGRIGDPRPTAEREIISEETVNRNIQSIHNQIDRLIDGKAELVDNYDWMKDYTFLNFLRDIGKYINVNYMLDKDIIRRRLETGITFAEFSYMLMQGYDFLHLYQTKNCIMQVAGSDQWGNITTGVDLIRKVLDKTAYAFTMPLILDPTGKKFGKSEGNALWLDKNKTSAYEIYQYLINADDSKVLEYLKVFTFLSKEQIEDVYAQQQASPETRIAQKTLAWEVVKDIHGKDEADNAVLVSQKLFAGDFSGLSVQDIKAGMKGVPSFPFEKDEPVIDVLVNNKIASSKREARDFLKANAISVNGKPLSDETALITKDMALGGEILIFRRGKKKYFIGEVK